MTGTYTPSRFRKLGAQNRKEWKTDPNPHPKDPVIQFLHMPISSIARRPGGNRGNFEQAEQNDAVTVATFFTASPQSGG
jgi:hypothetical protein